MARQYPKPTDEQLPTTVAAAIDSDDEEDPGLALMIAAGKGKDKRVTQLLDAKADLHAQDDEGRTALMDAAGNGHTETVRLLIAARARLEARTKTFATALTMAVRGNHHDTVHTLLEAKAETEITENYVSQTGKPQSITYQILDIAAYNNRIESMRELLKVINKKPLSQKKDILYSAFQIAIKGGHNEAIECLLKHSASFQFEPKADNTRFIKLLIQAVQKQHTESTLQTQRTEIVTLLVNHLKQLEASNRIPEKEKFSNLLPNVGTQVIKNMSFKESREYAEIQRLWAAPPLDSKSSKSASATSSTARLVDAFAPLAETNFLSDASEKDFFTDPAEGVASLTAHTAALSVGPRVRFSFQPEPEPAATSPQQTSASKPVAPAALVRNSAE